MKNFYESVKICWIESTQKNGWVSPSEIDDSVQEINTSGYVIKKTNEAYIIAQSVAENPTRYNNITIIPNKCILTVTSEANPITQN